jgi:spore maturation protein CgeB
LKVLFINSLSADYAQDLMYSGLVKVLGKKNVIDYPWNKKYHLPYKKYPKNLGYTPMSLLSTIGRRALHDIDLVIVAASKTDCFDSYLEAIDKVPAKAPVIFLDGGDQPGIGQDLTVYKRPELYDQVINIRPFDLIFKREFLIGTEHEGNVIPMPFSFNLDRLPSLPGSKKYDVSFWAVESAQIRSDALDLLQDKFDCADNGTTRNQKFSRYKRKGAFYLQELSQCKIVLNFRGGGWDTMRYWEVPAVSTFMISQKPQIVIPNNFENHGHLVYCSNDLSDLEELCTYYLKHEDEREKIAKQGFEHLKKYHTDVARAEELLMKASSIKG